MIRLAIVEWRQWLLWGVLLAGVGALPGWRCVSAGNLGRRRNNNGRFSGFASFSRAGRT